MTPVELVLTAAPTLLTVVGSLVSLTSRLARQDAALEYLMRRAEEEARRTGSIPPPRQKLTTLTREHR